MRSSSVCAAVLLISTLLAVQPAVFAGQLEQLELSSAALEIEVSSYDQLRIWASRLGLSTLGSEQDLRSRLYSHFGIDPGQYTPEDSEGALSIELEYAKSLRRGDVIEFTGDVSMVITDASGSSTQTLRSDSVVINPDTGRIAAVGNVAVQQESVEDTQSFDAESFIITVEGTEGIFISAVSRFDRTNSDGETVEFYLSGDVLNREHGMMLIEDAYVSSDLDDAYYSLSSDTMRILPDGDWFLTHGVLHIGRVPVFYMPFLFYPAREFFFSPSFGFNSERGTFLNTTSYLFGRKKSAGNEQQSTFSSFLSFNDTDDRMPSQRDGLLIEFRQRELSDVEQWAFDSGSYGAVFADFYSEDGVYLSVDAEIRDAGFLDEFTMLAGITSDTQRLRYAIVPEARIQEESWGAEFSLPWYSDPDIYAELTQRNDGFDMNALFGGYLFDSGSGPKQAFEWDAQARGTYQAEEQAALLQRINVQKLGLSARWDEYDENSRTYELDSITYADARMSVSGSLFSFQSEQSVEEAASADPTVLVYTGPEVNVVTEPEQFEIPMRSSSYLGSSFYAREQDTPKQFRVNLSYEISEQYTHRLYAVEGYEAIDERLAPNLLLSMDIPQLGLRVNNGLKPFISAQWDRSTGGDFMLNEDTVTLLNELSLAFDTASVKYENRYYLKDDEEGTRFVRHRISASEHLDISSVRLTASASAVLPPLDPEITVSTGLSYGIYAVKLNQHYGEDTAEVFGSLSTSIEAGAAVTSRSFVRMETTFDHDEGESSHSLLSGSFEVSEDLLISQKLDFRHKGLVFDSGVSSVDFHDSRLRLLWEQDPAQPDTDPAVFSGWQIESGDVGIERKFWKDRISLSVSADGSWRQDLLDVNDNELKLSFSLSLSVAEFLDLSFRTVSRNTSMNSYFGNPGGNENIFADLLRSFNFFDRTDRQLSNFNLDSIQIGIVHYMKDWDLNAEISGNVGYDGSSWRWLPKVSVYVRWKAMSELDFRASVDEAGSLNLQ
jgi:hypothetical protein